MSFTFASLNIFFFMEHWLFGVIVESALLLVIRIELIMASNRHSIAASSASHSNFPSSSSNTHVTFSSSNWLATTIRFLMEFMAIFSVLSSFLHYCFRALIIIHLTHSTSSSFSSGRLVELLLIASIIFLVVVVSLLSYRLLVIHVRMRCLLSIRIPKYTASSSHHTSTFFFIIIWLFLIEPLFWLVLLVNSATFISVRCSILTVNALSSIKILRRSLTLVSIIRSVSPSSSNWRLLLLSSIIKVIMFTSIVRCWPLV